MSERGEVNAPDPKPIGAYSDDFFASLEGGKPLPDRRWRKRGAAEAERRESVAAGRRIVFTCQGDGKHAALEVGYADERRYGEEISSVRWELHPNRKTGGTFRQAADDGQVRSAADLKRRRSAEEAYIADGQGGSDDWGREAITASFKCSECGLDVRRREGRTLDVYLSKLPARLGASTPEGDLKVWTISVRALGLMTG